MSFEKAQDLGGKCIVIAQFLCIINRNNFSKYGIVSLASVPKLFGSASVLNTSIHTSRNTVLQLQRRCLLKSYKCNCIR